MREPKIFNYGESTYGMKLFGATRGSDRVDVAYFARVRSRNAFLNRLWKLPHIAHQGSKNWIRKRICQGEGGMEQIIVDDAIYVKIARQTDVIGKFNIGGEWIPFDPSLQISRSYLDRPRADKAAMTEEEKRKLAKAFAFMEVADELLRRATKLLAEFGMDVPALNAKYLELMGSTTNSVEESNQFIRSFIRVSVLEQIADPKQAAETKARRRQ